MTRTNPHPPAKPWRVHVVKDHGKGTWYRFSLQGENHYFDPPAPISWSVPDLDDPRFDLTNAVRT